ncbi:MAG: hypothetical protein AABW51_04400 [Nanoarchaeota archaeon]
MEKDKKKIIFREKIQKVEKEIGIVILDQENINQGFPHKCKKCEHDFAEVIDLGVSYSDESSVLLFRCKKCSHVERDAFGTSNN